MIRKSGLFFVCFFIVLFSCEKNESVPQIPVDKVKDNSCFIDGVASVLFTEEVAKALEEFHNDEKDGCESSEVNELLKRYGIVSYERIFPDTGKFDERKRREGLHRWYRVTYDEYNSLTKSSNDLGDLSGVEIFSPERKIALNAIFDDPKLSKQWHYFNDGSISSDFSIGADINVLPVWEDYTTGDRSVIVAIMDGGVDYEHEDLAANYVSGKNFGTGGKITPNDHGTHVAGTIAAVNNNGLGVAGIAGGNYAESIPGVGLLSCQVFAGNNPFGAEDAFVWAADNGAVISNNSWGYVYESAEEAREAVIPEALKAAIDYFIKYAGCDDNGNQLADSPMKGGVVIFSAGNDAWDGNPIGEYEPVISVGAIGPDYSRAYYSCYGDWVDIAAPGGSAQITSGQVLSTITNNGYGEMQGTSMACPHVSGVAALLVSYFGGPGFTNEMLKEKLLSGARTDILPASAKIGPLLDALGSITYGTTIAPDKVDSFDVSAVGNKVTVSIEVTEDKDDTKPYEYIVLIASDSGLLQNLDIDSLPEDVKMYRFKTMLHKVGDDMDMDIKSLDYEKQYYVCVGARDYAGNMSDWSMIQPVSTESNNPPVIELMGQVDDIVLRPYHTADVKFNIYDPEGGEVVVSLSKGLSGASIKKDNDGLWKLTITASIAKAGKYSGEITATDAENESSSFLIEYEILPNSAPMQIKDFPNILSWKVGEIFTCDLSEYFTDIDEEVITYKVVDGNKAVVKTSLVENILTITTTGFGLTSIAVVASDNRGATAQNDIKIAVKRESSIVEMYPVPVETILYVRTAEEAPMDIQIKSASGQIVYQKAGLLVSAFEPAAVDMSDYAPGRYSVNVWISGKGYSRVITKR